MGFGSYYVAWKVAQGVDHAFENARRNRQRKRQLREQQEQPLKFRHIVILCAIGLLAYYIGH